MIKKIQALSLIHKRAIISAFMSAATITTITSKKVELNGKRYDEVYDLAVIGGGSGGLATAF
jgi:hypothetical protein